MIPVEKYEYRIYSVNNSKGINKEKVKNFNVSVINAERDTFSENDKQNSYKLVSSLIERSIILRTHLVRLKEYVYWEL